RSGRRGERVVGPFAMPHFVRGGEPIGSGWQQHVRNPLVRPQHRFALPLVPRRAEKLGQRQERFPFGRWSQHANVCIQRDESGGTRSVPPANSSVWPVSLDNSSRTSASVRGAAYSKFFMVRPSSLV